MCCRSSKVAVVETALVFCLGLTSRVHGTFDCLKSVVRGVENCVCRATWNLGADVNDCHKVGIMLARSTEFCVQDVEYTHTVLVFKMHCFCGYVFNDWRVIRVTHSLPVYNRLQVW